MLIMYFFKNDKIDGGRGDLRSCWTNLFLEGAMWLGRGGMFILSVQVLLREHSFFFGFFSLVSPFYKFI